MNDERPMVPVGRMERGTVEWWFMLAFAVVSALLLIASVLLILLGIWSRDPQVQPRLIGTGVLCLVLSPFAFTVANTFGHRWEQR